MMSYVLAPSASALAEADVRQSSTSFKGKMAKSAGASKGFAGTPGFEAKGLKIVRGKVVARVY
jgi:hypothetical protein